MQMKDLLPLAGVVLGWILAQLEHWVSARRDEKKAIARTLADLLEIRHSLLAVSKAVEFLSNHLAMPRELQPALRAALAQFLPADGDFAKRYAESVSLVAACNPILGFRLRSQDIASPVLQRLREIAVADPSGSSPAMLAKMEPELLRHLNQHFEKLVTELAWMHGLVTWWRVRQRLKRPMELPDGLLESLKAVLPAPPQQNVPQAEPSDAP